MTEHTTELYFESHITIDPVPEEGLDRLKFVAEMNGFRVADLVMPKTGERSTIDSFMTARGTSYDDLLQATTDAVDLLIYGGYHVRRFKIENTLIDVRFTE